MKILCFGEILWDVYPDRQTIGGAPYNVAAHIFKLGGESYILSGLGEDELGLRAMEKVKGLGVKTDFIKTDKLHPTGTAVVTMDERAVPTFTITADTAYDNVTVTDEDITAIKAGDFDMFYFGTLAQKGEVSRKSVMRVLSECSFREVFFDINLRKPFYTEEVIASSLPHATILKINDDETALVGKMIFGLEGEENIIPAIFGKYEKIHTILVTKGPDGARVYHKDGSGTAHYDMNYCVSKAVDTVGSGDAFSAGFIISYLRGDGIEKAGKIGNIMGDFVASQRGAIPDYDEKRLLQDRPLLTEEGIHGGTGAVNIIPLGSPDVFAGRAGSFSDRRLQPHSSIGVHRHVNDADIYYIISGLGFYYDNGTEVPARPGDLFICGPGEEHGLRNDSDEELRYIAIGIKYS